MKKLFIAALLVVAPVAFSQETMKKEEEAPMTPEQKKRKDLTKLPFGQDSVKQVVLANMDLIQSCYNEMLASTKKKIEGDLMTSFTITPEGMVKNAKVEKKGTTLKDPKFHECVVATLTAMEFPKPADKHDHPINFPFKLKAVE